MAEEIGTSEPRLPALPVDPVQLIDYVMKERTRLWEDNVALANLTLRAQARARRAEAELEELRRAMSATQRRQVALYRQVGPIKKAVPVLDEEDPEEDSEAESEPSVTSPAS